MCVVDAYYVVIYPNESVGFGGLSPHVLGFYAFDFSLAGDLDSAAVWEVNYVCGVVAFFELVCLYRAHFVLPIG